MSGERRGYRGYISSRPLARGNFPQRVQNLVIRNYAAGRSLPYKLSLTEYAMPGCFMMMETLLSELTKLEGVIMFSMFMLPPERSRRAGIYERVLAAGASLHAALEQTAICRPNQIGQFEDTILLARALQRAPLQGRYYKDGAPLAVTDSFTASVLGAPADSFA